MHTLLPAIAGTPSTVLEGTTTAPYEPVNGKEVNVVEKVKNKIPPLKRRKCLMCDYEAETGSEVRDHKKLTHNWCCLCFSNFKNKDLLKKHIEDQHKVEI